MIIIMLLRKTSFISEPKIGVRLTQFPNSAIQHPLTEYHKAEKNLLQIYALFSKWWELKVIKYDILVSFLSYDEYHIII